MNFLAIVAILSVAAENTATLEFSDIKLISDSILCKSLACAVVLNKIYWERFSKTDMLNCLESVSIDCRYDATVHMTGELNELCSHHTPPMHIVNVTDIILPWGSFAASPNFKGFVVLLMQRNFDECNYNALPIPLTVPCTSQEFPKDLEDETMGQILLKTKKIFENELTIDPQLFVRRLNELKSDGLLLYQNNIHTDPWVLLQKVYFSDVSWNARFEGFRDQQKCPNDYINAAPIDDSASSLISAAAATNDVCSAVIAAVTAGNDSCSLLFSVAAATGNAASSAIPLVAASSAIISAAAIPFVIAFCF